MSPNCSVQLWVRANNCCSATVQNTHWITIRAWHELKVITVFDVSGWSSLGGCVMKPVVCNVFTAQPVEHWNDLLLPLMNMRKNITLSSRRESRISVSFICPYSCERGCTSLLQQLGTELQCQIQLTLDSRAQQNMERTAKILNRAATEVCRRRTVTQIWLSALLFVRILVVVQLSCIGEVCLHPT